MAGRRLYLIYYRQNNVLNRHIFICTLLLDHIKNTFLRRIHDLFNRLLVLIAGIGNLFINTDQSAQHRIISHCLRVLPDVRRYRYTINQLTDIFNTGKFLRDVFHLQAFLKRQNIYRLSFIVKFYHGLKKDAELPLIKIISCKHLRCRNNRIRIHDHGTDNRFLRIDAMGHNLLYNRLIHVLCLLTQVQYRPNQSLTRPVLNGLSVIYCNCSEPSKISKNRYKMLAFLRLFLKFYLADTPHRRNA